MFKKTKLIAGIALLIQSLTFLVLFFVFFSRKKKSANAYLGVSLAAALSGAALIIWHKEDEKEDEEDFLWGDSWDDSDDLFDDAYDNEIDCVIEDQNENTDEVTTEAE